MKLLFLLLALMAGVALAADIETYCRHSLEDQCLNKWAIIDSVDYSKCNINIYYRTNGLWCDDTLHLLQSYFIGFTTEDSPCCLPQHAIMKKDKLQTGYLKPCPQFEYKESK